MSASLSWVPASSSSCRSRLSRAPSTAGGSAEHPLTLNVKRATALVKERAPDLVVDGEIQANVALDPELITKQFPFSKLKGDANVFIFPDLNSGNNTPEIWYPMKRAYRMCLIPNQAKI